MCVNLNAGEELTHGIFSKTAFQLQEELVIQLDKWEIKTASFKLKVDVCIGIGIICRLEYIFWRV